MQGIEIIRGIDGMWEKIFHETGENGWLSQEKTRYCIVSLPPFSHHCQESKLEAYRGLAKAQKFKSVDNRYNLIYPLNLLVISNLSVHFIKAIGILYAVQ